jgi:integrase
LTPKARPCDAQRHFQVVPCSWQRGGPITLASDTELETVRTAVRSWVRKERSGPRSSDDIADIIELMLAVGGRIGEVLALRWVDTDLDARVVEINATIKAESGVGTYRKPIARARIVALPEFAALVLRSRRRAAPDNFLDAVFPTRNGTWQQVNNVERRWRQIRRDADLEWVTTEVFRRGLSQA